MCLQLSSLAKWLVALHTLLNPLPTVSEHVLLKMSPLSKWFVALCTFVQLFSSVNQHMKIQATGMRKWLQTHGAWMPVDHFCCWTFQLVFTSWYQRLKIKGPPDTFSVVTLSLSHEYYSDVTMIRQKGVLQTYVEIISKLGQTRWTGEEIRNTKHQNVANTLWEEFSAVTLSVLTKPNEQMTTSETSF